jgi:2-hydroxychromene-2-carboxylate isomerase
MKQLSFYFDPVSPFAYLAFEHLPQSLIGVSYAVSYRPVLFAALLNHWGQKGPAEIVPKRAWTYRHVSWLAKQHGIELQMPAQHPFNPLPLLRLLWACARDGDTPNRYACEAVLRHVWRGGARVDEPNRLEALERELAPVRDPRSDALKAALRAAGADAAARGVFGVPTIEVDGRFFWGFDALPMVSAYLRGDPWFDGAGWTAADSVPEGASRKR